MKQYNLGFLGFGNVGRALARLLVAKSAELRELGIEFRITGIASRRLGWLTATSESGFDVAALLANSTAPESIKVSTELIGWLETARPDVVFETTSLNPETGEPSLDYLRAVL